jgi:hypothetical protein
MARRADRRAVIAALVVAYVAAWVLVGLIFDTTTSDLDLFFWPSAQIAAHGHPLLVYSTRVGQYPNANGPLSLIPLTGVVAVADLLGWQDSLRLRAALTLGVFAVFSLLLAVEAVRAVEAGRGRLDHRLPAAAVILLAPPLWMALADFGHVEQPIELWLTLLAVRFLGRGRTVRAGILLGLAGLTRTVALICAVPLILLLLRDHRPKSAAAMAGATVATGAAGLLPFYLADHAGLVYSLVTYRGGLPIGGGSLWLLARGTSWTGLIQHGDAYLFGGAAILLCAAALWRRPAGACTSPRLYGLLAVAAACVPMLAKTSWPYYILDAYVFAAIWWMGRSGKLVTWRALAPLIPMAGTLLATQTVTLPPTQMDVRVGVAASLGMAAVVGIILGDWFLGARWQEASERAAFLPAIREPGSAP